MHPSCRTLRYKRPERSFEPRFSSDPRQSLGRRPTARQVLSSKVHTSREESIAKHGYQKLHQRQNWLNQKISLIKLRPASTTSTDNQLIQRSCETSNTAVYQKLKMRTATRPPRNLRSENLRPKSREPKSEPISRRNHFCGTNSFTNKKNEVI